MINFKKAALSAVVGTLGLDLLGLALTGTFWDIPALLAGKLAVPLMLSVLLHYTIGFTLAVIYGAFGLALGWLYPITETTPGRTVLTA